MVLKIPGAKNIFPHSRAVETGLGKERVGQATVVVALDGTGDFDSIQEAIDFLPSAGGMVFIKEGTYNISTDILITKSNVMLAGTGYGTILNALDLGAGAEHGLIKIGNGSDVVQNIIIQELRLEGNFLDQTNINTRNIYCQKMRYSHINNIWSSGSIAFTIELKADCIYNKISNSFLHTKEIKLTSANYNTIVNNTLYGVYVATGASYLTISSNFVSEQMRFTGLLNSVINSNVWETSDYGITFVDCNKNCIVGNNIFDTTGDGIKLTTSDNNIISSNNIHGNDDWGIDIVSGNKNTVIGNICLTNTNGQIQDNGTDTHPNGASGTNNLALDDLNIIA